MSMQGCVTGAVIASVLSTVYQVNKNHDLEKQTRDLEKRLEELEKVSGDN
jgi:hypothetical protein